MNAEELIRSGLLEAYVLGQASPEEVRLVEWSRASDASVRAELEAIEIMFEQHAVQQAIPPPPALKANIMERIAQEPARRETPVVPIATVKERGFNWLAAASVIGLLVSAGMNFLQYNELRNVRGELARLENDRSVLAEELQVQRASLQRTNEQLAVITDPHRQSVLLNGVGKALGSKARIYWDMASHQVHIDPLSLAALPEGQQYQLWALVDGKPVDAGMIAKGEKADSLQEMKDVPAAQAFAVTIEMEGGSPTPTLEAMVLLGNV
ncbi:MAG: anti-sigma factor [Flavobacteriales bacterium]|nr:anti-sigma factor [Flavobacteriales bacterium]